MVWSGIVVRLLLMGCASEIVEDKGSVACGGGLVVSKVSDRQTVEIVMYERECSCRLQVEVMNRKPTP
jgi:hypothetical protein